MLAVRASAARSASRLTRNFATVVDAAGVKVAAVDNGEPTSSVTFLFKAGSRFENKPGVAHALQNFAYKSTTKRSALATVREAELYGGVLSSSLSREYLALTAEFLRGDEPYFVDVLSSFVTDAKFTRHELQEYVAPVCAAESTVAASNPATRALELAHAIAFRNGLGASIFASEHSHVDVDDHQGICIVDALTKLLEKSLGSLSANAAPPSSPTSYFGGETRVDAHSGPQTVFIGFGTTGAPSAELAVLAAHLSPQPSVKWSEGLSPIAASIPKGASVQAIYLPYSDASLFGLLVQGATAEEVKIAGKAAVSALKEVGNIKAEDVKKAVAKAKFSAASTLDGRSSLASVLGSKLLSGPSASVEGIISSIEKVDASALSSAVSSLIKAKPTYVTVGDIKSLPYADELGL
ncbi:hypothetical protein EW026_g6676 [Hermanssonia centrifuga]|uniref:Cytochrome b-c1 complex subunit 2, mitochondrial n=1 Tax=Hermanssonia centrifuga TaxID=98765 RepID=A0A4S4KA87_9APHY|nr:hypothetical protein EW026_g6676 [Hermanssonia centrifuga]